MERLKLTADDILCGAVIGDDGVKKYPITRCDTGEVIGWETDADIDRKMQREYDDNIASIDYDIDMLYEYYDFLEWQKN